MNSKNTKQLSYIFLGTLLVGCATIKVAQRPFEQYTGVFLIVASLILLIFWEKLPVQQLFSSSTKSQSQSETDEDKLERKLLMREEYKRNKDLQKKNLKATLAPQRDAASVSPDSQTEEIQQRGRSRELKKVQEEETQRKEKEVQAIEVKSKDLKSKDLKSNDVKSKETKPQEVKKEEKKEEVTKGQKGKKQEEPKKVEEKKQETKKVDTKAKQPEPVVDKANDKKPTKKKTEGEKKKTTEQKNSPTQNDGDDEGWEKVEAPQVKQQQKSNKKQQEIKELLVEVVEHIKPEVIVKAVVHTVAPVTVVPDVVEPTKKQPKKASLQEDDGWDEVVVKKDTRQATNVGNESSSKKNKGKKQ